MYGGDILLRFGDESFSLQLEGGLKRGESGNIRGFLWSILPSLSLGRGDLNIRLAYNLDRGYNWDPDLANPLGNHGATYRQSFSLEGSLEALRFRGKYDFRGFGRFEAAYRFSW